MKALVVGGTGETGQRVVQRLLDAGSEVRVSGRSAARVEARFGPYVESFEADLRDPDSLVGIADGIDVAVCTVGSRTYFGANGGAAVDALGTRHLVDRLLAEGGPRLVFLSAWGLDRHHFGLTLFSKVLGDYFAHKATAEAAVRGSGLPYCIVRPVELRNRPGAGRVRLNQGAPMSVLAAVRGVSRDDVAEVLADAARHPESVENATFEVFGGDGGPLPDQLASLVSDAERPTPPATPLWG